jgi:hypothetical protein
MGFGLAVFVSAVTVAKPSREQEVAPLLVTATAKPALLIAACPWAPNFTESAAEAQVWTVAALAAPVTASVPTGTKDIAAAAASAEKVLAKRFI